MTFPFSSYQESAEVIRSRLNGLAPEVVLVLGSGLGYLAGAVDDPVVIPYGDIPHFPVSTAPGHAGRLVCGTLSGRRVAVMDGRLHFYEGWSLQEVCYPIRTLKLAGCSKLFLTNAAGCVNEHWRSGDVMLLTDHIKFFLDSPLRGENLEEFGPRFPDMTYVYSPALQAVAREVAQDMWLPLREGVYCFFPGPQFETPAEVRCARTLGADAVGMSTVPEAIAAAHCGMEVLAFSLLTNMAAGILPTPLSGAEVNAAAEHARPKFSKLVLSCLERM